MIKTIITSTVALLLTMPYSLMAQQEIKVQGIQITLPQHYQSLEAQGASFAAFAGKDGTWISLSSACASYLDTQSDEMEKNTVLDQCFNQLNSSMSSQGKTLADYGIKDTVMNNFPVKWAQSHVSKGKMEYMNYFLLIKGKEYAYELQLLADPKEDERNRLLLSELLKSYREVGMSKQESNIKYKDFEKDLAAKFCDCLESYEGQVASTIVYTYTEHCLRKLIKERRLLVNMLIEKDESLDMQLTKAERRNQWERQLAYDITDDNINRCDIYRSAMVAFKKEQADKIEVDVEQAKKVIQGFEANLGSVGDEKERSNYHILLGIMKEYVGDKKGADESYKAAIKETQSTAALALKLLLNPK